MLLSTRWPWLRPAGPSSSSAAGPGARAAPRGARSRHEVTGIDLSERVLGDLRRGASARARRTIPATLATTRGQRRRPSSSAAATPPITVPFAELPAPALRWSSSSRVWSAAARTCFRADTARTRPAQPGPGAALPLSPREPAVGEATAEVVEWTAGREIRWWATVTESRRAEQVYAFAVVYRGIGARRGAVQRLEETLLLRYVFQLRAGALAGAPRLPRRRPASTAITSSDHSATSRRRSSASPSPPATARETRESCA